MLENSSDERRLCDGGDDTHLATAARTGADVDREHPAQVSPGSMKTQSSCETALHPAHRRVRLGLESVVRALRAGRHCGDDVRAMFNIRGKQAVIAHQMGPRSWHQLPATRSQPMRKKRAALA